MSAKIITAMYFSFNAISLVISFATILFIIATYLIQCCACMKDAHTRYCCCEVQSTDDRALGV